MAKLLCVLLGALILSSCTPDKVNPESGWVEFTVITSVGEVCMLGRNILQKRGVASILHHGRCE